MINSLLSAILRGSWFIEEAYAMTSMPLVIGILNGAQMGTQLMTGQGEMESPFFVGPDGVRRNAYKFDEDGRFIFDAAAAVEGCIAVVPFIGPMIKYNGSCGEPGMVKRQAWISQMTSLPTVKGYASIMDTPGGQADGTPQTAALIQSLSIPTAAIIAGQACSAGAWISSGHDFIYALDEFSEFGSIGAYQTVVDPTGVYEKQGYKIRTVYPKISRDKNLSYRKAIAGDVTMVEEEIGGLAQMFVDHFAHNRSGYLNSDIWMTGKVFSAKQAAEIGLITGIKTMDEVMTELRTTTDKTIKQSFNNSTMKTSNIEALSGIENPTDDQLALANADFTAAGLTTVTIVPETLINEAQSATAENSTLKSTIEQLTQEKTTLTTNLSTANAEIAELKGKVVAFGKNAGAINQQKKGDDVNADNDTSDANIENLSHNQYANDFLGI